MDIFTSITGSTDQDQSNNENSCEKPRLNFNLLLELFEKLLFESHSFGPEDLRPTFNQDSKANLLRINARCFEAFITCMAKCEEFSYRFTKSNPEGSSDQTYELQKYQSDGIAPYSSFIVTPGFIFGLLVHGKFRIKAISVTDIFLGYISRNDIIPSLSLCESRLQGFSQLFLHRGLEANPTYKSDIGEETKTIRLNLGTLRLTDDILALEHICLIMNLDSNDVDLHFSDCMEVDRCYPLPQIQFQEIHAPSTEKITMQFEVSRAKLDEASDQREAASIEKEFLPHEWIEFINYIFRSCENLKELNIMLVYQGTQSFDNLLVRYQTVANGITKTIFPSVSIAQTKINLKFTACIEHLYSDFKELTSALDEADKLLHISSTTNDWENDSSDEVNHSFRYQNSVGTEHSCTFTFYKDADDNDSFTLQEIFADNCDYGSDGDDDYAHFDSDDSDYIDNEY